MVNMVSRSQRAAGPQAIQAALLQSPQSSVIARWVAAGGIVGAIAASSCCIVPLVLFSLGISGAWIGNLTALEPFKPVFVAVTLGFLGYGHWLVFGKPKACSADAACARPLPNRLVKSALWVSTVLILIATFWNRIAPVIAPIILGL